MKLLNILEQNELYKILSENDRIQLISEDNIISSKDGNVIYINNSNEGYVYLLLEGMVRIWKDRFSDNEFVTDIITPDNIFGTTFLINIDKRNECAETAGDCIYIKMDAFLFNKIMNRNPKVIEFVMSNLNNKSIRRENRLATIKHSVNVKARLAWLIVDLCQRIGKKVGDETMIKTKLTHNDLADFLLTTRQSITQSMNELKRDDLIYYDRDVLLVRNLNEFEKLINIKIKRGL